MLKANNSTTFFGSTNYKSNPVTGAQVLAWLAKYNKGATHNVSIVPTATMQAFAKHTHHSNGQPNPLPFTNMQANKQSGILGKRASIMWAAVQGVPAKHVSLGNAKPIVGNLQQWLNYSCSSAGQQSPKQLLDLVALLSGGFSGSSKTYGQPFVKLVIQPTK